MSKELASHLYHDNFQNFKPYGIPKAQLVIADIPYNIGADAYGSNPTWYVGGDNKNGESDKAKSSFFNTDGQFRVAEYMHFCSTMLKKEPKERNKAPCMLVFCAWDQQHYLVDLAKRHGFNGYIPITFIKDYSAQVLKANMRIVGATEYGLIFYRDKLPKFNNGGRMVFDYFKYPRDTETPKIHPTQKPVPLLKEIIKLFTDVGDVVIDPCAGSGSTLIAADELGRKAYGFECDTSIYRKARALLEEHVSQYDFETLLALNKNNKKENYKQMQMI